ncbi:MAG: hypothetical protein HQK54_10510, partial [Oligoflexales bacterium]|nr:hypothetical protein [Oligoflexales bacterium]
MNRIIICFFIVINLISCTEKEERQTLAGEDNANNHVVFPKKFIGNETQLYYAPYTYFEGPGTKWWGKIDFPDSAEVLSASEKDDQLIFTTEDNSVKFSLKIVNNSSDSYEVLFENVHPKSIEIEELKRDSDSKVPVDSNGYPKLSTEPVSYTINGIPGVTVKTTQNGIK